MDKEIKYLLSNKTWLRNFVRILDIQTDNEDPTEFIAYAMQQARHDASLEYAKNRVKELQEYIYETYDPT